MKYLLLSFALLISHQAFSNINADLIAAVKVGNLELAQDFLAKGANPNTINSSGSALLHLAIINIDKKMVKLLLKNHANPSIEDTLGLTPLDYVEDHFIRDKDFKTILRQAVKERRLNKCKQVFRKAFN